MVYLILNVNRVPVYTNIFSYCETVAILAISTGLLDLATSPITEKQVTVNQPQAR